MAFRGISVTVHSIALANVGGSFFIARERFIEIDDHVTDEPPAAFKQIAGNRPDPPFAMVGSSIGYAQYPAFHLAFR
jgi:hypothetical protein